MLFRFDRLVKAFVVAASEHKAAGEFVNDYDLIVFYYVVDIALHYAVRLQRLINMVRYLGIFGIGQVCQGKITLSFTYTDRCQRRRPRLFVYDIILGNVFHQVLAVGFFDDERLQVGYERIGALIKLTRFIARTRNNQRRSRFIDKDAVDFVNDREVQFALHELLLVYDHIVPKIIESELVIRGVRDIAIICGAPLVRSEVVDDASDGKPKERIYFPHPLAVSLRKVVVYGDKVYAFSRKCVQVRGERRYERLSFTRFHLGDPALMKHDTAEQLHVVMPLSQHAFRRLAHDRKRFRKNVVKCLSAA